jgi:hypothetical protein
MVAEKIVSLAKQKKNLPTECSKLLASMGDGGDRDDGDDDDGVGSGNEDLQGIKLPVHSISLNC